MANPRLATVVAVRPLSDRARMITLATHDGPLGFVGGQYLIFDTGLEREGRKVKRAYSILSSDSTQERFEIAVLSLGPGSAVLQTVEPGKQLPFSGPWGQFLPDDAQPRETLIVATDTGITAALGLLRGRAFATQLPTTRLLWLVEPGYPFLSPEEVRALCGRVPLDIVLVPPARHPERLALAASAVAAMPLPESAFLCGDGTVVHAVKAQLAGRGTAAVRLECFFDNPQRKAQP